MKNCIHSHVERQYFLILFLLCSNCIFASSFRQYSTKEGLSDPIVSGIYQDDNGLLWLGTNNGINTFNGLNFQNLFFDDSSNPFAGCIIGEIFEAEDDILWVLTDKALVRLNRRNLSTEKFNGFDLNSKMTCGLSHDIYVVKEDNTISYYTSAKDGFKTVPVKDLVSDNVIEIFVDNSNNLWIFTDDGNHRSFAINNDGIELKLTPSHQFRHPESLLWCFYEDGLVYFVDATLTFYEYNLASKTKNYIQDVREQVLKSGEISSIIKHKNDFFVGFARGGLLRIKNMPDQRNKYQQETIALKAGVLALAKDKYQDLVWVGTDGEGIYMYFNEASSLKGVLSSSLPNPVRSPITSLYLDSSRTLWLATAGSGVVNIHNYNPDKDSGTRSDQFSSHNSMLGSDMVYDVKGSKRNLVWVGTENGLSYYSYQEWRIKNLQVIADGRPLKSVRSVCELNDTTLWVTTAGDGVVKIRLTGSEDNPVVVKAKRFIVGDGYADDNTFTAIHKEDNNTIFLGTVGKGVYKVDSRSEKLENIQLGNTERSLLNNVYSIHKNKDGYWFGTADGLVHLNNDQKTIYNDKNGFPFKMISGVLEDTSKNLWLITNKGIVKFNTERLSPHLCKQSGDRIIADFAERACYKDPVKNTLYFGGANGFIKVNENEYTHQDYTPAILFTGLSIFGKQEIINNYFKGGNSDILELNNDQNVFTISFAANDFVDGGEYTYFYRLNEQGENWVDNGSSNSAFFTYLNPGTYTLSTKYRNNVTGKESPVYTLKINILNPWYKHPWAYLLYLVLAFLIVFLIRWLYLKQNKKQSEIRYYDESSSVKLRFFACMANEVYSALAMIMNPARKIIEISGPDNKINTYTQVIQHNAAKLNEFIQGVSELRMLETGERTVQVQTLSVSEIADSIAETFIEETIARNINYQIKIDSGVYWNSDSYCLKSIFNNLLTYVFTYIEDNGTVSIQLSANENALQINITASEIGSNEKQIRQLFNLRTILQTLETRSKQGYPVRNELLLANCAGMVKLLEGEVKIDNTPDNNLTFTVNLPQLEIKDDELAVIQNELYLKSYTEVALPALPEYVAQPDKLTIMLLSKDPSLVWLIADHFGKQYNLDVQSDTTLVPELLKTGDYNLIILEANLGNADGIELIKNIKQDPATQISCIILASENSQEEKFRSMDAGVEIYIEKPFDMSVLEKEVERIMEYKELQEYYTSSLNRKFELGDEAFPTKEDRKFYDDMINMIDANLTNPKLSVEMICNELEYTSQDFYIKLKEITSKTPNEIIREYRLSTAELLLISTSFPVDEIMEKSGFSNKDTFVKVFTRKFGMDPRNYREQHKKRILAGIHKRKESA